MNACTNPNLLFDSLHESINMYKYGPLALSQAKNNYALNQNITIYNIMHYRLWGLVEFPFIPRIKDN